MTGGPERESIGLRDGIRNDNDGQAKAIMGQNEDGSSKPEKQRRQRRVSLDYDVTVGMETDAMFYTGLLKDISSGGLFIATTKAHHVGDNISLQLNLPGTDDPLQVTGVIKWLRGDYVSEELPEGVGVELTDLAPEVKKSINQYLVGEDPLYFDHTDDYSEW